MSALSIRWCGGSSNRGQRGQRAHQGFCSTQVVLCRIPFADLKALVETPLAEEDANQFIDVDVRPTKSTYSDEEIWQLLSALSGASNATQFQALPRPQQKLHLFAAHEEGIGPRTPHVSQAFPRLRKIKFIKL